MSSNYVDMEHVDLLYDLIGDDKLPDIDELKTSIESLKKELEDGKNIDIDMPISVMSYFKARLFVLYRKDEYSSIKPLIRSIIELISEQTKQEGRKRIDGSGRKSRRAKQKRKKQTKRRKYKK